MTSRYIAVQQEVQQALNAGRPVVALESTILAHGMPYPESLETAMRVERIIREAGAIPATIAILNGQARVGLDAAQLEALAQGETFVKATTRDLPFVMANGLDAATTVAATMFIASLAGVEVFVTGGIGGVHRNAQQTFDVSADLIELAKTSVAVVCAGAKAILDIGLTLEFLETHGVPVIGYRTDEFPAFYVRNSGFKVDYAVQSVAEVARAMRAKWGLGLKGGVVVANPIPEQHEPDAGAIEISISEAVKDAKTRRISGKALTPFLLSRVEELTGGESLKANIELVCDNARLGAELSKEYAKIQRDD